MTQGTDVTMIVVTVMGVGEAVEIAKVVRVEMDVDGSNSTKTKVRPVSPASSLT
jgi:hypothetical protein